MAPAGTRPPSLDELCNQALRLPCAPILLPKLTEALQREETTAGEIESIIQLDSSLAAATLRLANSAYYGGARAETLEEAIIRLGQVEIYRLAALALVSRWEGKHALGLRCEAGDFSRYTLGTALGCEVLAEITGRVELPVAYTGGLVWELGRLALAHVCAPWYPQVRARRSETDSTWEAAERAIFGYDHAAAGARLLRAWRFPSIYIHVTEHALNPEGAPDQAKALLAHLHAAKYMATAMGPGVAEDGFFFSVHGDFLAEFGINQELIESALPEVLGRALARLGDKLHTGPVTF